MSSPFDSNPCSQSAQVGAYALGVLPPGELAVFKAHLQSCSHCRHELGTLSPIVETLAFWPSDDVRPASSLRERLARRITPTRGATPLVPAAPSWNEPEWEEVAPGIFCKLMATDTKAHRVSMLVRLMPGVDYPPHTHAGLEELFLLDGELWIDDRKLHPGDYNRAEAGSGDKRVWSETGCTCVLITSTRDILQA
jgi:anti-sigma factor ChrR (cupin superfamily)